MKRLLKLSLIFSLILALATPALSAVQLLGIAGAQPSAWVGLSTDVKPTTGNYGSSFYETNTGLEYIYTNAGWVAKKTTVTGAVTSTSTIGSALPAGENHVGEIGGNTKLVSVTPTVTAGAYHANDVLGGIQTLTNALRVSAGTAVLQSVTVRDLAAQNVVLQIFFFNANPATGTYTDNGAFDLDDTDSGLCIGKVTISASDYISLVDNSVATITNCGLPLKATTGTSLYAIIRTTGTPTYASTSDLKITFGLLRD